MEGNFLEKNAIASEIPVDINGAGLTGKRIDMRKTYKLAIKVRYASAAADADISLQQHDAASGGNSKALSISNAYYKSIASAAGTKVDFTGSNLVDTDLNGADGEIVIEINAEDLDVNNGFAFVSANLASPGAIARVVAVDYIGHDMRSLPGYDQVL